MWSRTIQTLIFLLTLSLTAVADKFDSSVFKDKNAAPPPAKSIAPSNKPAKSSFKPQTLDVIDESMAQDKIKAVNTLLAKEKNTDRRRKLLFNKGILYLQYARLLRMKSSETAPISKKEQLALRRTADEMNEIIRDPKVSAKDKAYAYYITGMTFSSAGQDERAIPYMQSAINLNPLANYVVGVSLFLGEYYFDHEKYKMAIDYYKKFYTRMSQKEKALAKYKTAWSYWNLHELEKTQTFFVELAKDKSAGEFSVDANKDLAYVMTQFKSEAEILSEGEKIFSNDEPKRLIFLLSAYQTLRRQKHSDFIQKIFQTILQLEKVPSKKITLWLDEIRNNKFEYASANQYTIFEKMRAQFAAMSPTDQTEVLKNAGEDMENEVQGLVRSFVDTYAGRVKNIEKIDRAKLAIALENLFVFHDTYFPQSKVKMAINELWLDICTDQKNLKCVYDVSSKILADPTLTSIHERANIELLAAVDELFRQDENKYRADYVSILEKYTKNPAAARWLDASKRLSAIYLNSKQYDKAVPILAAINDRERSPESFYRLELGLFDAQRFQDVVDAVLPSGVKPSEKTIELIRESSLKLAIDNEKDPAHFAAYEKYIEKYLDLNTDRKKSLIVLHDYLNHLIDRKEYQKASERLLKVNKEMRESLELHPIGLILAGQSLKSGTFGVVDDLIPFKGQSDDSSYERFLAKIGKGKEALPDEIDKLDVEKRKYILGLLTLTKPQNVIDYIKTKKILSPELKKFGLLALQIDQDEKYVSVNSNLKRLFGNDLILKEDTVTKLQCERLISNTKVPEKADASAASAALLQRLTKRVRKIRKDVVQEIKDRPPVVQVRVLDAARKLEQSVADLILNSTPPENLAPEQVEEYKAGLNGLAKEYLDQAADFAKSAQTLSTQMSDNEQETQSLPRFDSAKWDWPKDEASQRVISAAKSGKITGAILSVDMLLSAHEISNKDYLTVRAGVLLMGHSNNIMADYVRRELLEGKQDGLMVLEEWKKAK